MVGSGFGCKNDGKGRRLSGRSYCLAACSSCVRVYRGATCHKHIKMTLAKGMGEGHTQIKFEKSKITSSSSSRAEWKLGSRIRRMMMMMMIKA